MLQITENNFKKEVLECKLPIVLDFWAEWCGPCRMMGPVFESVSEDFKEKVKFGKVNVDEEEGLAAKFDVRTIPSLIVIKDGREVERTVGFVPKENFKKWVNENI